MPIDSMYNINMTIEGGNALVESFAKVRAKLRTLTLHTRNVKAPIVWRWRKWRNANCPQIDTYGRDGESLKAFARRVVHEGHPGAEECAEWLRRKGCCV